VILRRSTFAILGLLAAGPLLWAAINHVRSQEETWDLVERAATAFERVSYAGEASWRRTKWNSSMSIERDAENGLTRYRSSHRWSWVASRPSTRTPDPAAWCLDLEAVTDNYDAREGAGAHLFGRPARTVTLEPRHAGRPRVRLTLDAATGLPLKVETFTHEGKLYRTAAFRALEIGPRKVERRRPSRAQRWLGRPVAMADLDEASGFDVWVPAYLPAGFRCIESRVRDGIGPEVILLYSDGITAFEIEQELVQTPARIEAAMARKLGPERAAFMMRGILNRRMAEIAESEGGDGEGAVVRRWSHGPHCRHRLRVGERDISVSSRQDFDREEIVKVLRSLRPR
jgi:hypothetical protein